MTRRGYGWIRDVPDRRDVRYRPPLLLAELPSKVDLRRRCPPPFDQGNLGSCTANAVAMALMFDLRRQRHKEVRLSRLFLYYLERVLEGTVRTDAGAQARDGMKVAAKIGVCTEGHWRYVVGRFRHEPPAKAYLDAPNCRVAAYRRLGHSLWHMKACLASGYPFVFGITVYTSFEGAKVARTGVVDLPARHEHVAGGHSVLAVGYDDAAQRFTALNSWGAHWGQRGFFTIPYAYLTNPKLSGDFWMATALAPVPLSVLAKRSM